MARFYELFAGIGLVREALEPLGWECVWANDFDPKKRAIYRARFPGEAHADLDGRNLFDVDPAELPRPVDLVASSFPCIDLSLAGKRGGLAGDDSGAFWAFVDVLEGLRDSGDAPRAVMIENVEGFLTSNGGEDFHQALQALNRLGYRLDVALVTAERFTPQSRPRIFVLALREDVAGDAMTLPEESGPEGWAKAVNAGGNVRPKLVRKMMLGERPGADQKTLLEDGPDEDVEPPQPDGDSGYLWGAIRFPEPPRRGQDFADIVEWDAGPWWPPERVARFLTEMGPLHRARVDAMVEGSLWNRGERFAATAYRRRRNGRSVYEVRSDGVAGCLRTARGGSSTQLVIVAEGGEVRVRKMTPKEYARLQGCVYQDELDDFPENDLRTAFGDAVCVPAVEWVAAHAFGSVLDAPVEATGGVRAGAPAARLGH